MMADWQSSDHSTAPFCVYISPKTAPFLSGKSPQGKAVTDSPYAAKGGLMCLPPKPTSWTEMRFSQLKYIYTLFDLLPNRAISDEFVKWHDKRRCVIRRAIATTYHHPNIPTIPPPSPFSHFRPEINAPQSYSPSADAKPPRSQSPSTPRRTRKSRTTLFPWTTPRADTRATTWAVFPQSVLCNTVGPAAGGAE